MTGGVTMLVDCHQHLILPGLRYAWTGGLPALAGRTFELADYRRLTGGRGIAGTIFMEADAEDWRAEARAVAALASDPGNRLLGIIAACRPESDDGFEAWLDEGEALGVVGYRRILHESPDDLSRSEPFRANLRRIGARGLPFDLCFLARQLPVALDLVRACPEMVFVLDHCGVPDIAGGALDAWRADIGRLAAVPNLYAKISGVFAYCGGAGKGSLEAVRPVVEHVLERFGPARCLWGSDWPVVDLGGDLPSWIDAWQKISAGLSADEAAAVGHKTAAAVYGVRLPEPGAARR